MQKPTDPKIVPADTARTSKRRTVEIVVAVVLVVGVAAVLHLTGVLPPG